MKKLLLGTLILGTLFSISCKKADNFDSSELLDKNQKLISDPPPSTAVLSPTLFFIDKDTLWTITNIAAPAPVVSKKSNILNITTSGNLHQNVFNFMPKFIDQTPNIIYNPFLDRLLTISNNILHKCFTPSRNTNTTALPHPIGNIGVPIRVNLNDKKLYYFTFVPDFPRTIRSINMDGTNDVEVTSFLGLKNSKINQNFNGDIDFTNSLLYFKDIEFKRIGIKNLKDPNAAHATLSQAKLNETFQNTKIVYDNIHRKVFFSAKDTVLKKLRIYSIDVSGIPGTLKKIVETDFANSLHSLTFDIFPETNVLFWCKREFDLITFKHISTLTRTNLDGGSSLLIHTGNFINTVVAARPVTDK